MNVGLPLSVSLYLSLPPSVIRSMRVYELEDFSISDSVEGIRMHWNTRIRFVSHTFGAA